MARGPDRSPGLRQVGNSERGMPLSQESQAVSGKPQVFLLYIGFVGRLPQFLQWASHKLSLVPGPGHSSEA